MRNAGLEEAQAGIKIAGRNINNLRCADDTTLMWGNRRTMESKVAVQSSLRILSAIRSARISPSKQSRIGET